MSRSRLSASNPFVDLFTYYTMDDERERQIEKGKRKNEVEMKKARCKIDPMRNERGEKSGKGGWLA